MANHTFNPHLPELGEELEQPSLAELKDIRCFKYADYRYVWDNCNNDYVRYVLDIIPIFGKHERILIDVKIHDLTPGTIPCIPGWHLDGSINPEDKPRRPETLTLFVTGQHARTKFLADPIDLPVEDKWSFAMISRACSRMIPEDHAEWQMPSCTFGTYDDHYFHRGVAATSSEKRLLIRTTETDIIRPRNKIYTPYKHS